jgi:hypothetical protein
LGLLDEHEAFALFPLFLDMQGIAVTSSVRGAGPWGRLPEARERRRSRSQYVYHIRPNEFKSPVDKQSAH